MTQPQPPTEAPLKVRVLYTGGTVGMRDEGQGFRPAPGVVQAAMAAHPAFQDPDGEPGVTPPLDGGRRVRWQVDELSPLLDSSNIGPAEWDLIAQRVLEAHEEADGIVILHGTDTMAWTASALSFMLEGLQKPVVLTGAQIPLTRTRNDAVDNLLQALTFAGPWRFPEVSVCFGNRLFRGNRARKVDADGLFAFDSPNLPPLATVGVEIQNQTPPRPASPGPLRVRPIRETNVVAIRLFPGIQAAVLRNLLAEPVKGAVIETFGAGNAPDTHPDLHAALREAAERGVVLVNCTQCLRGTVRDDYAAGRALRALGLTPGHDLTPEAALTKLAWLLSDPALSVAAVRARMGDDLRGELTPPPRAVRGA